MVLKKMGERGRDWGRGGRERGRRLERDTRRPRNVRERIKEGLRRACRGKIGSIFSSRSLLNRHAGIFAPYARKRREYVKVNMIQNFKHGLVLVCMII
jgi:hypothetical protein